MRPIKNTIEDRRGWKIGDIIQCVGYSSLNCATVVMKKVSCIRKEGCEIFIRKECSGFYIVTKDRNIEGTMQSWHEIYKDFRTVEGERNEGH